MPIRTALSKFKQDVAQCDALIANGYREDSAGSKLFPQLDRDQITEAAFLNMFKAWESFLETTLYAYMTGSPTLNGSNPNRYVLPPNIDMAKKMASGHKQYFDFANPDSFKKLILVYFDSGYPFASALNSISSQLEGMRTIRNACAHISTNTQTNLESLALALTAAPQPRITVADLLLHPIAGVTPATIFSSYSNILVTSAELIANG